MGNDGNVYGIVYEDQGRFYYYCRSCCYGCSGSDEAIIDQKADDHEKECPLKNGTI